MSSNERNLTKYAWLSIAAAIITIALKAAAYWITGSVGLLSDALESLVNLVAAIMALWMLSIAAEPPDDEHHFGHDKAEYFSSALEGGLIFVAAASIIWSAVPRLIEPRELESVGIGLAISVVASLVNLGVSMVLFRAAKQYHSITLEADAHHLMTDVWTSVGVVGGVLFVSLTGWQRFDPIIAILVALNIVWTGWQLMHRSALGLMDTAVGSEDLDSITKILDEYVQQGIEYNSLRTRQSGSRRFVYLNVLVPGDWTVDRGHDICDAIEQRIHDEIYGSHVFTHLEPKLNS